MKQDAGGADAGPWNHGAHARLASAPEPCGRQVEPHRAPLPAQPGEHRDQRQQYDQEQGTPEHVQGDTLKIHPGQRDSSPQKRKGECRDRHRDADHAKPSAGPDRDDGPRGPPHHAQRVLLKRKPALGAGSVGRRSGEVVPAGRANPDAGDRPRRGSDGPWAAVGVDAVARRRRHQVQCTGIPAPVVLRSARPGPGASGDSARRRPARLATLNRGRPRPIAAAS